MAIELLGLPRNQLEQTLGTLGVPAHHAGRVFSTLHRHLLPASQAPHLGHAAAVLAAHTRTTQLQITGRHRANDGTTRLVFTLEDGARIEGVLLPNRSHKRVTLCLSSQVGCAMGCQFCATGTLGLTRNLTAGEIVAQVHAARTELAGTDRRLTRLVFMGMGEPMHNAQAVGDAIDILLDSHGQPLARRNITVSTVGHIRGLRRLSERFGGRVQLAISLHAGTQATRERILPLARSVSLAELRAAVVEWDPDHQQPLMLEYVLLPGVNDTPAEWDGLARWAEGLNAIVNLIPFNPFPGSPFRSPDRTEIRTAYRALGQRGIRNSVRWPRGRDAQGACGQLMLAESVTPQTGGPPGDPDPASSPAAAG